MTSKKRKTKKHLFKELSFVENHVDTFYIGLNDNPVHGAYNPMTAKLVDVDQDQLKDWVHPDTQLVRTNHKKARLRNQRLGWKIQQG